MRKKPLRRILPDPKLPLIGYTTAMKKATPHNAAIATIVAALDKAGIRNLNYDHVKLTIPKKRVPLYIEHRRFDIAYAQGEDYIFLDVFALHRDLLEVKERDNG